MFGKLRHALGAVVMAVHELAAEVRALRQERKEETRRRSEYSEFDILRGYDRIQVTHASRNRAMIVLDASVSTLQTFTALSGGRPINDGSRVLHIIVDTAGDSLKVYIP